MTRIDADGRDKGEEARKRKKMEQTIVGAIRNYFPEELFYSPSETNSVFFLFFMYVGSFFK